MRTFLNANEWRVLRLKNYRSKLRLCRAKALNRLMLFDVEGMTKEFDSICDAEFRSNHEPGISFLERKERTQKIYFPEKPKPQRQRPTQLTLF